jgi:hypothetical protein
VRWWGWRTSVTARLRAADVGTAWHSKPDRLEEPTPEDADPAEGAPVTRCKRCGLPGTTLERCALCERPKAGGLLIEGLFVVRGWVIARLTLCEADLWQLSDHDPRNTDPLYVGEGAR